MTNFSSASLLCFTITIFSSLLIGSARAFVPFAGRSARRSFAAMATPPVARRDEGSFCYAGVSKLANDETPRQAESSLERLMDPPRAIHDPYGWLRDESREKEEVLAHLNAENAYTEALTEHLEGLRGKIYREMLTSIQETDFTVPRPRGDYLYYSRTFEGKSYSVYCRAPMTAAPIDWDGKPESPILPGEVVLLDVNELARGQKYCSIGAMKASPSNELIAYSVDFTGGETCQLFVKNVETGEIVYHDEKLEIDGSVVWGKDDTTVFYLKMDAAHRPHQVYKRVIGSDQEEELLFQEDDEEYWMGISKSLDGKYFFIETSSKETTEQHYLDLETENAKLECVAKKREKVLYDVDHRNGQWWITTNVGGTPNMRLMTCPVKPNSENEWTDVVVNGENAFDGGYSRALEGISSFSGHLVAEGREGGIPRVWVLSFEGTNEVRKMELLVFDEEAHDVGLSTHYEFDTDSIVVSYDSLITPPCSLEISLSNPSERTVLKAKNVPGYDKSLYGCDRLTVKSRDGTVDIPVSIVYRTDLMEEHLKDGKPVHTHLYGYGSYGACMEADFSVTRLSLLRRGMVYVIAHVRGGGEMGRQWYEEPNGAKFLCKKNTFNDFVDVANWLIDEKKLTKSTMLSCEGRSAGGLLVGASINQAPHLFKMALLGVPFVDVVPTMIDATIPLTAVEVRLRIQSKTLLKLRRFD
jgi:oligopeptidase B